MEDANRGANATITIDLQSQEITCSDGQKIRFEIDSFRKQCLLEGLDEVGQTMQADSNIGAFERDRQTQQPWAAPSIAA